MFYALVNVKPLFPVFVIIDSGFELHELAGERGMTLPKFTQRVGFPCCKNTPNFSESPVLRRAPKGVQDRVSPVA